MTDPHQLARTPASLPSHEPGIGRRASDSLVPLTVVGGYLGAGKTTLINALLGGNHGRRLAVLVNDFGSVNIDADLITTHDGQTISLENGCVCCSMADAMGDALDRVLALDPPPEQIIVEASGVADPAKVAIYGRGWPGCRLDAVVVLADATTVRTAADDRFVGGLILRQLRSGDIVLLTKSDVIEPAELTNTHAWITGVAPNAELLKINRDADLSHLLLTLDPPMPGTGGTQVDHGGDAVRADELFVSTVLPFDRPVTEAALTAALLALPAAVVRVKGFVRVAPDDGSEPTVVTVHKVGDRLEIEPTAVTGDLTSRLVAISVRHGQKADGLPFDGDPLWGSSTQPAAS